MKLSISNIAWDPKMNSEVISILQQNKIAAIDIAPGRLFNDGFPLHQSNSILARNQWNDAGIEWIGMQSLLYGTQGLNLFGSEKIQNSMQDIDNSLVVPKPVSAQTANLVIIFIGFLKAYSKLK